MRIRRGRLCAMQISLDAHRRRPHLCAMRIPIGMRNAVERASTQSSALMRDANFCRGTQRRRARLCAMQVSFEARNAVKRACV